jgi:hypothetical protein
MLAFIFESLPAAGSTDLQSARRPYRCFSQLRFRSAVFHEGESGRSCSCSTAIIALTRLRPRRISARLRSFPASSGWSCHGLDYHQLNCTLICFRLKAGIALRPLRSKPYCTFIGDLLHRIEPLDVRSHRTQARASSFYRANVLSPCLSLNWRRLQPRFRYSHACVGQSGCGI